MPTVSFWQRRHSESDTAYDVAIVGGGIIGVSTAYWLAQLEPRTRIAIVEAGRLASGASGRNAGFLLQGVTSDYVTDRLRYGEEKSRRLWQFTRENRELIARHVDARGTGLETSGSLVVAGSEAEDARLQAAVQALRSDGQAASYLPPREVARKIGGQGFLGGLYVTSGASLDPVALVRYLAEQARCDVLPGEAVVDLHRSGSRLVLETAARRIFAERVVLAMGAYLPRLLPQAKAYVRPVRAQMLATEAAPSRWLKLPVYSHEGFFYLRQLVTGEVLVGGARHLHERAEVGYDDATTGALQADLEAYLYRHFPQAVGLRPARRWGGTMGFSPDGLPVAGQPDGLDHAFFATGFTGHGMGYGFRFGRMMAEWVSGDPSPAGLELFHASRLQQVV